MFEDRAPATIHDRTLIIRASDQLRGMDDAGVLQFAEYARYQYFAAGEYLTRADERLHTVHMIYNGRVEIRRAGQAPFILEPPSGVGWPSLLSQTGTNVDCIALTDTSSLTLAAEIALDLFEHNFSLVRNSLRFICTDLMKRLGGLPAEEPLRPLGPYPERPLTLVERMISLSTSTLFASANADAIAAFARTESERRLDAGETIWRVGDPSPTRMSLTYGRVRCTEPAGRSVVVGAPYTLGFLDAMATGFRVYDVVCETPVVMREAQLAPMLQILEDHPSVALQMVGLLTRAAWGIKPADDAPQAKPKPAPGSQRSAGATS